MRKAKFRSWNDFLEIFAYFENGKYWYDTERGHFDDGWHAFDWNNAEQYTGMEDKNGKEIYEGDMLKVPCQSEDLGGKVVFETASFWCNGNTISYAIGYGCEIIGNIHQEKNP